MNQQQLLIALLPLVTPLATLAVVIVGFLYNNARLNDLRDMLRAEIKAAQFSLESKMDRNHTEVLTKLAQLEGRVGRVEERVGRIEEHLGLPVK